MFLYTAGPDLFDVAIGTGRTPDGRRGAKPPLGVSKYEFINHLWVSVSTSLLTTTGSQ